MYIFVHRFHLPESRGNLRPILCAQGWWKTLTKSSNQIQGESCKTTTKKRNLMRTLPYHDRLNFFFLMNKVPDPLELALIKS